MSLFHIGHIAINWQPALICFLTILQYILAYLAEIEIKITAKLLLRGSISFLIEEGVHEPELDVLYVLSLKVGIIHLAHHTAPSPFRI